MGAGLEDCRLGLLLVWLLLPNLSAYLISPVTSSCRQRASPSCYTLPPWWKVLPQPLSKGDPSPCQVLLGRKGEKCVTKWASWDRKELSGATYRKRRAGDLIHSTRTVRGPGSHDQVAPVTKDSDGRHWCNCHLQASAPPWPSDM